MCYVVDTLETGLNHATEQLPFSDYGYEAINQPLYREEWSESKRHALLQWDCHHRDITSKFIKTIPPMHI